MLLLKFRNIVPSRINNFHIRGEPQIINTFQRIMSDEEGQPPQGKVHHRQDNCTGSDSCRCRLSQKRLFDAKKEREATHNRTYMKRKSKRTGTESALPTSNPTEFGDDFTSLVFHDHEHWVCRDCYHRISLHHESTPVLGSRRQSRLTPDSSKPDLTQTPASTASNPEVPKQPKRTMQNRQPLHILLGCISCHKTTSNPIQCGGCNKGFCTRCLECHDCSK